MAKIVHMICPFCHNQSKLYLDYQKINKGDYQLRQCRNCRLVYTEPLPANNFLKEFYQSYDSIGANQLYYKNIKNYQHSRVGRDLRRLFLQLAETYQLRKDLPLLDLGSGGGMFLDILKNNGYNGLGVEVSRPAVEFAEKNFGVKSLAGDMSEIELAKEKFGAIFMWDLLEHLREPEQMIQKINQWLVRDGYLIIETPNCQALINNFILFLSKLGIVWPAKWMFGLHHLFWHSKKSLIDLLEKNNFKILELKTKNTPAYRIFPWNFKYCLPRLILMKINILTYFLGGKNKLLVVAKKIN